MEQPTHAWDRTSSETPQSWAAFLAYLHQPPGRRSLARLGRELGRSKVLLEGWSSKHAWQARVAEWDRWLEEQRIDATVGEARDMAKRQAQASDYMLAIWLQRAQALVANNQVDELPIAVMPRWLDVAVRVGRLARGDYTAGEQPPQAGPTLGELFIVPDGMTDQELARLVVEQVHEPDGDEDLDQLADDLEEDLEQEQEPTVHAVEPVHGVEPEPEPEERLEAEELPAAANGDSRPARWVLEDGHRVQAPTIKPAPDPGWQPLPPPRRARARRRR
jgi:hypothetical protein